MFLATGLGEACDMGKGLCPVGEVLPVQAPVPSHQLSLC